MLGVTREQPTPVESQVHPIVVEAARLASPDARGRVDFSDRALSTLRKQLSALELSPELPSAVTALLAFAAHLHRDCQSEAGGLKLVELAAAMSAPMRQRIVEAELSRDAKDHRFGADPSVGSGPATKVGTDSLPPKVGALMDFLGSGRPGPGIRAADLIAQRSRKSKGVRS